MVGKRSRSHKGLATRMARKDGPLLRPRRRKPIRTRRRFGWGWIRRLPLLWFGALVACVFIVYFFVASGVFSVRTVLADHLSQQDIEQIATHCECIGDNIFVVRADEIQRRLTTQLTTLVITTVYTRLPNLVVVEAYHKQQVAIWRTPEAAYGVDAAGEVLQVWKRPFPRHGWGTLPVFDEGYDAKFRPQHRLLIGEHIPVEPLTMALTLQQHLPVELRSQVKRYVYTQLAGMTLQSRAGWWAFFGMDYSAKLDVHIAALEQALATQTLPPKGCIGLSTDNYYSRPDHGCSA